MILLFVQLDIDDLKCSISWMSNYRPILRTHTASAAVESAFESSVVGISEETKSTKGTLEKMNCC